MGSTRRAKGRERFLSNASRRLPNAVSIRAMILRFLGAARTVTGSMHLLEVNGSRILLDCGLWRA
jgi:predicted metal-dependent RNase